MSDGHDAESVCDVCGRARDTRVCASSMGPATFGYCEECLEQGAEPLLMVATAIFVAGGPNEFDPAEFEGIRSFLDSAYIGMDDILQIYPDLENDIRKEFSY